MRRSTLRSRIKRVLSDNMGEVPSTVGRRYFKADDEAAARTSTLRELIDDETRNMAVGDDIFTLQDELYEMLETLKKEAAIKFIQMLKKAGEIRETKHPQDQIDYDSYDRIIRKTQKEFTDHINAADFTLTYISMQINKNNNKAQVLIDNYRKLIRKLES